MKCRNYQSYVFFDSVEATRRSTASNVRDAIVDKQVEKVIRLVVLLFSNCPTFSPEKVTQVDGVNSRTGFLVQLQDAQTNIQAENNTTVKNKNSDISKKKLVSKSSIIFRLFADVKNTALQD